MPDKVDVAALRRLASSSSASWSSDDLPLIRRGLDIGLSAYEERPALLERVRRLERVAEAAREVAAIDIDHLFRDRETAFRSADMLSDALAALGEGAGA